MTIVKDMGIPIERLSELLTEMIGVRVVAQNDFIYSNVNIKLEPNGKVDLFGTKRTAMILNGEVDEIDAFYTKFLINHTTVGG